MNKFVNRGKNRYSEIRVYNLGIFEYYDAAVVSCCISSWDYICVYNCWVPHLASMKSKAQRNTLGADALECRCLVRATDGKKSISTSNG
ncbi:hypothetical protein MKW98_007319 [Papaver atlanticum]|uniref:Uncharacterized protein n=1 Tax=Papaver atlanticum TaxID=357466 RepID=A0AAD4SC67_9MAGN|nr:hypothetical protein MKW98_007319 [Papaver atlanticum]